MFLDPSALPKDHRAVSEDSLTRLSAPFNGWTPEKVLTYFQTRNTVRYFALRDEEQANPTQIKDVLRNRFDYNNEMYDLSVDFDWNLNPSQDIEWLILLHKFYFAPGLGQDYVSTGDLRYVQKWLELTESWIDTVSLDFLPSDVMGRRVQNWIFAHYYFVNQNSVYLHKTTDLSPKFYLKFLHSLHTQVGYLCENLTPARNHRTIELYAIFMAAVVFPEFKDAAQWLDFSRRELHKNMQTDLLADGVHCELSTDYHHLVIKNYLGIMKLAKLNQITMPTEMDELLQKALEFAMIVHKPDGLIPSLSDGDVHSYLELLEQGYQLYGNEAYLYVATQGKQGQMPAQRSRTFPAGGYTILRSGWGSGPERYQDEYYLIFDCGPLGRGNHGHLDLLSIEMAAFGQSLIVDPGRYTYNEPHVDSGQINWRALFRGTGYHNTVQVDGQEQTRYIWHKNRYKIRGPEPDYELKEFITCDGFDFVHGIAHSHEYDVVHERKIFFVWPDYWIITDILRAEQSHTYDLRFHLSDSALKKTTIASQQVHAPHLILAQPQDCESSLIIEKGYISRSYGIKQAAPIVRFSCSAVDTLFHTVVYPYQSTPPCIQVKQVSVSDGDRSCTAVQASALQITVTTLEDKRQDTYLTADSPAQDVYSVGEYRCTDSLLLVRQDLSSQIQDSPTEDELDFPHPSMRILGRPDRQWSIHRDEFCTLPERRAI